MVGSLGKRRWGVAGVVVLAGAVGWAWWQGSVPSVVVQSLQAREMLHTVVATATVQTPHRASSGVQMAGKVAAVNVLEGDHFRQGQVLLTLDDAETRAALSTAQLGVLQAEYKLRQWREVQAPMALANDHQAQAIGQQAQHQLMRQQALFAQGFIGQAALDEALRAAQVAQAQADSASAQRRAHEDQGIEKALALSALMLARTNAKVAQVHWSYSQLRAPFDGMVVTRMVEPGDAVQPGKTLLLLAPQGETELVALIDERNLAWLRTGQPALAAADAFAQQPFTAVLTRIAPGVDAQRGSVQVKLTVASPPEFLRQDMTVSVQIEVARQASTLSMPLGSVHESESAQPWVWRVTSEDRLERVPVTLGLRSGATVELLAGVLAGERVLTVAGSGWHAGQRVRPRQP